VTSKIKEKHVPYMMGQHWMVHRTNLVVEALFNLLMVAKCKLEDLLLSLFWSYLLKEGMSSCRGNCKNLSNYVFDDVFWSYD
jgi:hypothetical protein